jgi:primosomal protein N' (replication factor Y)
MGYVEVAVDAPVGPGRTFSYSLPPGLELEPGQLVWVPFGRRTLQGVVMELTESPQVDVTRDVLQGVEPSPVVSLVHLALARWLSSYYLCSLFSALGLMLPPGFEGHVRSRISTHIPAPDDLAARLDRLAPRSREALATLAQNGSRSTYIEESPFVKLLGRWGDRELTRMIDNGLVDRRVDLPRPQISPKYQCYLTGVPAVEPETVQGLPRRQAQLMTAIVAQEGVYPATLANKTFGHGVAQSLVTKGLVALDWVRQEVPPMSQPSGQKGVSQPEPLTLTAPQQDALDRINQALDDPALNPRSLLLHGVTGSGKTEVYLRAIQRVVDRGDQAIFMVPEISLTPQTLERVNARFPGKAAVLHSGLTPRQRFDRWWEIRDGMYDVVVGPRSSLFAPVPRLGIIVIDEEHEWTYKQVESHPLYHARKTALELSRSTGAVVVLGSATPDVETYHQAQQGRHRLLELPQRIPNPNRVQGPDLAQVEICDMRQELRDGNRSIFSRSLTRHMEERLRSGQQTILFLNRRGSTPIVQCRDCGYVATCSRCTVSLTYHSADSRLVCHRCNRKSRVPTRCRQCNGVHIRQLGIGTQRVVDEVAARFPGVRVDRWDSDTTRAGADTAEIMGRLNSGETQVLVGTQMVAKGLDVPNVTLVGVILADVGLFLPDFRAGERNFGLLCQVAGRAGRGDAPGNVVIQTYRPDHYAIAAAASQDYGTFYQREILFRRQTGNPPFNQLAHIIWQDTDQGVCQRAAVALARQLNQQAYDQGLNNIQVIGPAPGIPSRLRGRHRWHLLVRGQDLNRFLEGVSTGPGCTVDLDPVHVL